MHIMAHRQVVKGGAADRAGLEDDDIVVEVNGVNVEQSTHEEAVNLIRSSGDTLVLLVTGKEAYEHLKAKGVAITSRLLDTEKTPVQSRERVSTLTSDAVISICYYLLTPKVFDYVL